jgi:5'-AMP-activated protein kinase, regulatory gamma subunit
MRRVHRLVVVEGEVSLKPSICVNSSDYSTQQEEEKQGGKKGRLLGIITLSDVLRYVIGEVGIGEYADLHPPRDFNQGKQKESDSSTATTTTVVSETRTPAEGSNEGGSKEAVAAAGPP